MTYGTYTCDMFKFLISSHITVNMIQSKILIFLTFLDIICITFADDIETLQKDIKKLKNKDKQILKKLDGLTENHDVIDAAIEELENKQNLLESLFDELEQKDMEMNQTLEEFKNKQLEFDEMIEARTTQNMCRALHTYFAKY